MPTVNQTLLIYGWGETVEEKGPSENLKRGKVYVMENKKCESIFESKKILYPSTNFCAGKKILTRIFFFY